MLPKYFIPITLYGKGLSLLPSSPFSDGFLVQSVQGMLYNPISGAWSWTSNTEINYALHAVKQDDEAEDGSTPLGGPR